MARRSDRLIILLTTLASVILINLLAADHFFRFDLTRDQVFTLSEASRTTMEELEDPLTVTAYFSEGLPPSFEAQSRQVRDLLEEYRAASKGMLSFEFIDPQSRETDEDEVVKREVKRDIFGRRVREQTSVEKDLEALGIRPVEIRVIEDDAATTRVAYLGLTLEYREELDVIPVVQSVASVEYDMTTLIRRLTRTKVPVVGVLQGRGEADLQEELSSFTQLLNPTYEVRPVELGEQLEVPEEVDGLLIAGTREAYDEPQQKAIDQFLMQGKAALFLLDLVAVDLRSFQPTPVEHGFGDLLASYGIRVGTQLVADTECASLSVAERRGNFTVQRPVMYPLVPQPRFLPGDSALTRDISNLAFPFPIPLFPVEIEGVETDIVAKSSTKSWLEAPEPWRLSPQREWRSESLTVTGPYNLVLRSNGLLPSHFVSDDVRGQSTEEGLLSQSLDDARVAVVGTSQIARNELFGQPGAALLLNLTDWLLLDPALLEMRTRGSSEAPVDPELSKTSRSALKYGNVVGVPILLGLYGLIRRMGRERRRALLGRGSEVDR